jgi:glycosyltransferase involved in cell wall biosynthesis
MPPLVSIVIPCFKGAAYLPASIESCLRQTHAHFELIIVDDASPDNCAEIAERYAAQDARIRVFRHAQNGGIAAAFNSGFLKAKGEFFTRLAQDDLFREDALEIMLRRLAEHPQAGLVYCDQQAIHDDGRVVHQFKMPEPAQALSDGNKVGLCVMWRRAVWEKVGGFDMSFTTAEDFDYWCRVAEHFDLIHCAESPIFVRFHEEMGSLQRRARQELETARVRARYAKTRAEARRHFAEAHYLAGHACRQQGEFLRAAGHFLKAATHTPWAGKNYLGLIGSLLRRGVREERLPSKAAGSR